MDSVGLKEAEFEVQCRTQQEQIEMLQQQLLEAQNQLKEQAVKHRQDQETLNMEISELKSQVCCNKALHDMKVETLGRELKAAKASYLKITQEQNEQNSTIANEKSEPLVEKDAGEQDKEEEDSLLKTAVSVHNSLQQTEDRQKMTTSKPAEVKTEAKTVQEKKTKKKRKWGCLGFLAVPVPDRQIRQLWGEQIKKKKREKIDFI